MNNKDNNKTMMVILLTLVSMIAGDEQQEQIAQIAASITGLGQAVPVGDGQGSEAGAKYLHGIRQLADYLGVSIPTAQKYKNSGRLDPAIRKVGRQFNFEVKKVDEIFSEAM